MVPGAEVSGLGNNPEPPLLPTCPTHGHRLYLDRTGWYCTSCEKVVLPVADQEGTA